ncbi:MAG: SURF1 family protein [Caulobacterales bacterium]
MTSEARRFPIALTITVAVALAIMVGLGVWQLQRHAWKDAVLARITALRRAPPQPIAPELARAARGENVEFTRVVADCAAAPPAAATFTMGVEGGQYVWRPLAVCPLQAPPYDAIVVDRGIADATRGQTAPGALTLPSPRVVVGVLRALAEKTPAASGARRPAPFVLVAERETPSPPGITPSSWATDIPQNLQYAGEYAPTWFGLAGALACVYAALLWRRLRTA